MIRLTVAAVLACAVAVHATAAISESDLRIAARALSFMERPLVGVVQVAIVYDPSNPQSAADATRLQQMLRGGLRVGNITFQGNMATVGEAASASAGLLFLTEGVGQAAGLAEIARARRIPCVTVDLAAVRSGACAVGVRAEPRVEILVNRAAAAQSGIAFPTAFRMLINEF